MTDAKILIGFLLFGFIVLGINALLLTWKIEKLRQKVSKLSPLVLSLHSEHEPPKSDKIAKRGDEK